MVPTTRRNQDNWASPFDMLRDFDRAFRGQMSLDGGELPAAYPVDIHETDNEIVVEAELPGFAKDQIDVNVEQGILSIKATREPAEPKGEQHLTERRYTTVQRRFSLPSSVDPTNVDAGYADGVLTLKLAKREEVKPRKIEVK